MFSGKIIENERKWRILLRLFFVPYYFRFLKTSLSDFVQNVVVLVLSFSPCPLIFKNTREQCNEVETFITPAFSCWVTCLFIAIVRNAIFRSPKQRRLASPPFTFRYYTVLLIPFWHCFLKGCRLFQGLVN